MKYLLLTIFILFCSPVWAANTYYVRIDGGTSIQCDGKTDHALAGATGTNCAFSHPAWALGASQNTNSRMVSGDTLIIDGIDHSTGLQAQYVNGYSMPNVSGSGCNPDFFAYGCNLNPVPAGVDSSHTTKIYGKTYDSGCTNPPQLWGQALKFGGILNYNGSNIDVQCLEITDHSACVRNGAQNGNIDGFPTQCVGNSTKDDGNWALDGIDTASAGSDNLNFKNLYIHGMAYGCIEIGSQLSGNFGNITMDNVQCIANGGAGIQTNSFMQSNGGVVTIENSTIDWTGCGERYPLQNPNDKSSSQNVHSCASQNQVSSSADAIAFSFDGNGGTPGNWVLLNDKIRFNTQDGVDLLHGSGNGSFIGSRLLIEGNAGQALKPNGSLVYVENSKIIGNCGFHYGQTFTSTVDVNGNPVEFLSCRANTETMQLQFGPDYKQYFYNNTILSNGLAVTTEGENCNAGTLLQMRNNIAYGGYNFGQDTGLGIPSHAGGTDELATFYFATGDGSIGGGACGTLTINEDYDIVYGFKASNFGCNGSHSQCGTDPNFAGTIKQGHNSLSNYYQSTDYGAQVYLKAISPAVNSGISSLTYQEGSNDYNSFARNVPFDKGALELNSTGMCLANATTCSAQGDCCSGNCCSSVCSASACCAPVSNFCSTGADCCSGICCNNACSSTSCSITGSKGIITGKGNILNLGKLN